MRLSLAMALQLKLPRSNRFPEACHFAWMLTMNRPFNLSLNAQIKSAEAFRLDYTRRYVEIN